MKGIRTSVVPGTIVVIVLQSCAVLAFSSRPGEFSGTLGTWSFLQAGLGLLPVLSVVGSLLSGRGRAGGLLLAEGLIVFWATIPDPAYLPVRWLTYAALVASACTFLTGWRSWAFSAGYLLQLLLVQHFLPGMTTDPPKAVTTLLVAVLVVLPGCLLALVRQSAARAEAMVNRNNELHLSVLQLTSANTEFLEQANTAGEESAVLERHRITRDLHDVVGQTLTNIIMMMDAALHRKAHDPEETVKLLRWIRKQAQTGLEETRGVLYELRALKPSRLRGLKALKKLVETFSRLSRIKSKAEWGNLPWTFDPEQEKAVYHLVQGSLSNAFRHGLATQIDLHFRVEQGVLHLMIRDNGRGGPDSALGLGQRGMEERLARWGGTVWFRSEPYGYIVAAAMPLIPDPKEVRHGPVQNPDRR